MSDTRADGASDQKTVASDILGQLYTQGTVTRGLCYMSLLIGAVCGLTGIVVVGMLAYLVFVENTRKAPPAQQLALVPGKQAVLGFSPTTQWQLVLSGKPASAAAGRTLTMMNLHTNAASVLKAADVALVIQQGAGAVGTGNSGVAASAPSPAQGQAQMLVPEGNTWGAQLVSGTSNCSNWTWARGQSGAVLSRVCIGLADTAAGVMYGVSVTALAVAQPNGMSVYYLFADTAQAKPTVLSTQAVSGARATPDSAAIVAYIQAHYTDKTLYTMQRHGLYCWVNQLPATLPVSQTRGWDPLAV